MQKVRSVHVPGKDCSHTTLAPKHLKVNVIIFLGRMSKRETKGGGESDADEEQDVKTRVLMKGDKVYQSVRTEILLREKQNAKMPREKKRRDVNAIILYT